MNTLKIKGINFTGYTLQQINHRLRQAHWLNLTELYYLLGWFEDSTGLLVQWSQVLNGATGCFDYQLKEL